MISDVYFPRVNGVSTSIRTFHRELTQLGHEVTLVAPAYPGCHGSESWIMRVPSRFLPMDPEDRMMRYRDILAMTDQFRCCNFDVIHIHTPFVAHYAGVALARRLQRPCVETCHTHFEEYLHHYLPLLPGRFTRFCARRLCRSQCNAVDALVVPSAAMREVLVRYGITRPLEIIATGLDDEFYRRGDGMRFRDRHGIDRRRPVLVYVGRVAHEKNIGFLLQVLGKLRGSMKDILLIIAGEGPALTRLQRQARSLGLEQNISFIGYLDRETDLLDCYCAGNVFVFSSRTETQGLVLLEAMAQGTPVVALSVLGTRAILEAGKGALVAEDSIDDFAHKVECILQMPVLHRRLSEEARTYAASWSARAFAIRAASLYEQTINNCYLN